MSSKRRCDGKCKRFINTRCLYKKEDKEYCSSCIKQFRKNVGRLGFRDSSKPPKHIILGKYLKKPKKERPSKEKPIVPKIPGAKRPRSFRGSPYQHLYLTMIEKEILYKKYVSNGLTSDQARERLSKGIKYLSELVLKMKDKGVAEEDINKKFKEEFAKLVECGE